MDVFIYVDICRYKFHTGCIDHLGPKLYSILFHDIVMIRSMWVTVCTNTYIQSMNNYHIVLNCSNHLCFIYSRFHTSPQIHRGLLVLQWQVWFMNGVVEMTDHSSFATAVNTHLFISQVISENTIWWSDSSNHIVNTYVTKWLPGLIWFTKFICNIKF